MKIGIIGLPKVGKKTLFELLTGHKPSEGDISQGKPAKGFADIKDPRFDFLANLYNPKSMVRARIDVELLPDLEIGTTSASAIFDDIMTTDAILHVVRTFKDDSIYHASGSIDPKRDIQNIINELILHDLIFIEKRFERIDKKAKITKEEHSVKEKALLEKLREALEKGIHVRLLTLSEDEEKVISGYPFTTKRPILTLLNVSEEDLLDDRAPIKGAPTVSTNSDLNIPLVKTSLKTEVEIAALESEKERVEFMQALGLKESSIALVTRLSIEVLGMISFFTVGEDEVRQWTIRKGSSAVAAAGAIHSDLARGFIRADVMKFADLKQLGSEQALKEAGKQYVKGKDYIVEDGDIINIRFSV